MDNHASGKIVDGFCYIDGNKLTFISLYNERSDSYDLAFFKSFIENNKIDETCMILANRTAGVVYPLYKFELTGAKSSKPIRACDRDKETLIKTCYKICIESIKPLRSRERQA